MNSTVNVNTQPTDTGALARLDRAIDWVGRAANWLALGIVLLVATNVILRYLASMGSVWAQELEWHLLAALILLGMSFALKYSEPIRVDIFYGRYSPRTRRYVDALGLGLLLIICLLFFYLSLHYVEQSFVIDEGSPDPGGVPNRWLVKSLIPAGFALLAIQTLAALARLYRAALQPSNPTPNPNPNPNPNSNPNPDPNSTSSDASSNHV